MSKQIKTYKFKLRPTEEQEQQFTKWIGCCCLTYNLGLEIINLTYKKQEKFLKKKDLQKQVTDLRNDPEFKWYKDVHSQVLQDATDRLYRSFDNFFRGCKTGKKVGYPSFTKKMEYDSFTFKQEVKVLPNENKIHLPKIGKVRAFLSEPILGKIKTCTIIREIDCWYACVVCEVEMEPVNQNRSIIGIDLGLIDLMVTSDAEFEKNPKTLNKYEQDIKDLQRDLARKKRGSNNYNKLKNRIAKKHNKIRNIRTDHLHKISIKLVNENQVIIAEKLNIKNMVKNHCLAKSIHDAAWGRLIEMIRYKCDWQDKTFVFVDPRNTTTDCNKCGHRNTELTLSDREWTCPACGEVHQRDHNSSLVIRERGIIILKESGFDFSTLKYIKEISSSVDGEPKNLLGTLTVSI